MKIALMVIIVKQKWINQHAMTLMSVTLIIQSLMAQLIVVLKPPAPILLEVFLVHVTQDLPNMWHGLDVGTSMSVLKEANFVKQIQTAGISMDPTIVHAWYRNIYEFINF